MIDIKSAISAEYNEVKATEKCTDYRIDGADSEAFAKLCAHIETCGAVKKEERSTEVYEYAAYQNGGEGIFVNYYKRIGRINVAYDTECSYFGFEDACGEISAEPQITQLVLRDFGLSYAVRLSDGRFIVIDGGREFESETENLYKVLTAGCKNPVIAAWFLSHPHQDHINCFSVFAEKYGETVKIENVIMNMPDRDDTRYPGLGYGTDTPSQAYYQLPKIYANCERLGIKIYTAHTGQIYNVSDAEIEILSCFDETVGMSADINPLSLIFMMKLGGQKILFTTDAGVGRTNLGGRYGEYIKADILQIPHHGFGTGDNSGDIYGFDFIKPSVCLLPSFESVTYHFFSSYVVSTDYIMRAPFVDEVIIGEPQRTITLPYTPEKWRKAENERAFLNGRDTAGSRSWIYGGINSSEPRAFEFTVTNFTARGANVTVELAAEGTGFNHIKITSDRVSSKRVDLSELAKKCGIGEDMVCTVRFISDTQIVVSHRTHMPLFVGANR